jgi:hypothetical protein
MSKINRLNIAKKFAEKNIRNLWFRGGYKTSYFGHYRFQYKQEGTTGLNVFDLFHDIAHAVDFISMGKAFRLEQVDFGFTTLTSDDTKENALSRMILECRVCAKQFILLKHFNQITCLDYFLSVEKHKLFDLEGAEIAFPDVVKLTESLTPYLSKRSCLSKEDWEEVEKIKTKRDKLALRNITNIVRKELKSLSSSEVISDLSRLNYLAKNN